MTSALHQRACQAVVNAVDHIRRHTGVMLPKIDLDFALKGHCAGQARIHRNSLQLRINLPLLERYGDDYLATTIPHEVSHLYVFWTHRFKSCPPRPHGAEWQSVMRDCFGLEPRRCHTFETQVAREVRRDYRYRCNCREHQMTRRQHKRIEGAGGAHCLTCKESLALVEMSPVRR